MNDIHFLRPYFLTLCFPVVLFALFLLRTRRSTSIWRKICSPDLIPYILTQRVKRHITPWIIGGLTLCLLIGALAGPAWQLISVPLIKSQSGLVIALDLSTAMNAEDIKPSRLQRAIYKINDLLNQRNEGQTALLVFSDEPYIVTPLTDDTATIKSLLPALETSIMPSTGHEVNKAIIKASELLSQAGISDGSILLVTSALTYQDMENSIESANQKGIKISVLGVGGEEAVPIPKKGGGFVKDAKGALIITTLAKEHLNRLATSTHGLYKTMSIDDSDINELAHMFTTDPFSKQHEKSEFTQTKWHDQGYYLVLLALPFAALMLRRGILVMLLFFIPYSVQAYSWDGLWKTSDQQAEGFFHQGEYQQAKELFQNSDWQAASHYKLNNYETAAQLFENNQTAEGLYNYGTTKAKIGDFESALAAYNKVLDKEPGHEDALYNKQLIEEFQKQQQQQQDNNQKNQDKDKQQKQDNKQDQNKDQNQDKQEQDQEKQQQQEEDRKDQKQDQKSGEDQQGDKKEEDPSQDPSQDDQKSGDAEKSSEEKQKEVENQYRDNMDKELEKEERKGSEQKNYP